MNKLNTNDNGGMPFEEDDIRWWDDAYREGFKGIASFLGNHVLLSGLVSSLDITGTKLSVTEGFIVLNGEILKVPATTAPIDISAFPYVYVELDVSYDPTGLEAFENGSQFDTYEVRVGKVNGYAAAQAGAVFLTNFQNLYRADILINKMILDYEHSFTKRQSMAQGSDAVSVVNNNAITLNQPSGNVFNLNIASANVPMERFGVTVSSGTLLIIRFTGSGFIDIKDGSSLTKAIRTRGGYSFRFYVGEVALFAVIDGKYVLMNGRLQATESIMGEAMIATQAEVTAGANDDKIITPLKLKQLLGTSWNSTNIAGAVTVNGGTGTIDSPNGILYYCKIPNSKILHIFYSFSFKVLTADIDGVKITTGFSGMGGFGTGTFFEGITGKRWTSMNVISNDSIFVSPNQWLDAGGAQYFKFGHGNTTPHQIYGSFTVLLP